MLGETGSTQQWRNIPISESVVFSIKPWLLFEENRDSKVLSARYTLHRNVIASLIDMQVI